MTDKEEFKNYGYDNSKLSPAEGINRLLDRLVIALEAKNIEEVNNIQKILYCFRQHQNIKQLHTLNETSVRLNQAVKDSIKQLEEVKTDNS